MADGAIERGTDSGGPAGALAATPPGPKMAGSRLGQLLIARRFLADPVQFVVSRFETYGDMYYVDNADGGLFVLRHPDHMQQLLVTNAAHYRKDHSAVRRLTTVLGDGLLTSDGDLWRRHRRLIQPAFHRSRLRAYAEVMQEEADRFVERLVSGQQVQLEAVMMDLTLRIVCRTLFGHELGASSHAVASSMNEVQEAFVRPDLLPAWVPTPGRRRLTRAVARLDDVVFEMIRERRARIAGGATTPPDLLQGLIEAMAPEAGGEPGLSEREVRDELVTLYLAGHETTALTLTYALYLLARHPDWARRVADEARDVPAARMIDDGAAPIAERVLLETMRLYPPAYLVARRAAVDTELGGYRVPAGSEVLAWIYVTHHDARWFPEPFRFDPDRFCEPAQSARPRLAFLPFGAGPRTCIGKHFALLEARIALTTVFRHVEVELKSRRPLRVRPRITLRPDRPVAARLHRRGSR